MSAGVCSASISWTTLVISPSSSCSMVMLRGLRTLRNVSPASMMARP